VFSQILKSRSGFTIISLPDFMHYGLNVYHKQGYDYDVRV